MKFIAFQQDYLWFLAALAWATALALIWRSSTAIRWRRWLAVAAAGVVFEALAHLYLFLIPEARTYELRPEWDFSLGLLGVLTTAIVGFVLWQGSGNHMARRIARQWLPGLALAAAGFRGVDPLLFGAAVAAIVLAAGWLGWRWHRTWHARDPALAAWALCFAVTPLVAAWGPLAHGLNESVHSGRITHWGLVAAGWSLGTGIWLLSIAWKWNHAPGSGASAAVSRQEALGLRTIVVGWFVLCGLLAWLAATGARRYFEQSAIACAQASVLGLDLGAVEEAIGYRFRAKDLFRMNSRDDGTPRHYATSEHLRSAAVPVARQLQQVERANPSALWAHIQTIRDGYLTACIWSHGMTRKHQLALLLHEVGPRDLIDWASRDTLLRHHVRGAWENLMRVRVPLVTAEGRMLGWLALDWGLGDLIHMQAQARVLVFAVAALGGIGLYLYWLQRVRRAERIQAAAEAEAALAADRMKSRFLAQVSHELRTPVQSIQGFAELAVARDPEEPVGSWVRAVLDQCRWLTRLIDDLIDLGMQQSETFRLTPRRINVRQLVSETCVSMEPIASKRNLALKVSLAGDFLGDVECDPDRFRQVLINLVANALKFTAKGGVEVLMTLDQRGDSEIVQLLLSVSDSGPGVPESERSRLFQPFSRLAASSGSEGAGLGLVLARGICRAMGGDLTLDADYQPGARFVARVLARIAPAECIPNPPRRTIGPVHRSCRILLVEDHSLIRQLFCSWLTGEGAFVVEAEDGLAAIQAAATERFDVAVIDLALPRVDGIETIARLLRSGAGTNLRIVAASAHAGAGERRRAFEAGASAFLTKPVSREEFLKAVLHEAASERRSTVGSLQERLSATFQEETPARLVELEAAIGRGDASGIRRLAHYFANSAAALGLGDMGDLARQCENAAENNLDAAASQGRLLHSAVAGLLADLLSSERRNSPNNNSPNRSNP